MITEGLPDIKVADSIVDYLAQFMETLNGNREHANLEINGAGKTDENGSSTNNGSEKRLGELGGFCAVCSGQMIKDGNCIEKCSVCGWIDPKGCGQ